MKVSEADIKEFFPQNPLKEVSFEVRYPMTLSLEANIYKIQLELQEDYRLVKRTIIEEDGAFTTIYNFVDPGENQDINIGEDSLSITLQQYESFERFMEVVKKISSLVFDNLSIELTTRIGLRYVNLFDELTISDPTSLEKFLRPSLSSNKLLSQGLDSFMTDFLVRRDKYSLNTRGLYFKRYDDEGLYKNVYVLDIDAFTNEQTPSSDLESTLDILHNAVQIEFLESITEECKKTMRGNKR